MNTYVKIGGELYPATIEGRANRNWDDRMTKAITLEMDCVKAHELFVDGATWSIVQRHETPIYQMNENGSFVLDENGKYIQTGVSVHDHEWDNSEYCLAGDLTDHRDGTITAVMGKLTDLEAAYEIILGGAE